MKSTARYLILLIYVTGINQATAAPITFNAALPVGKDEYIIREQIIVRELDGNGSNTDQDLDINAVISVLGYGVTPKFAVFAALPYLDKELSLATDEERFTRSSEGIGDLKIFGRYTFYQHNMRGRAFRLAAFAGIKAPTGDDNESDRLGRLPIPLQSGTGSWDGFGGVVATYQTLDFQIDGQLGFQGNGEANDFEAGDELRADVSFQYRLLPQELSAETSGFLYVVLESNIINREHNNVLGVSDSNSGGTTFFLSPGIQYVTKRLILETAVQIPVIQNLHGNALETDYVYSAGFRVNF